MDYINEVINCALQNEEQIDTKYTINIKSSELYENKYNFNNINNSDKIRLFYEGLFQAKEKMCNIIFDTKLNINDRIIFNNNNNNKLIQTYI